MTPELTVRSVPYLDPTRAFAPFAEDPYGAFLDGGEAGGRYSYIAADPYRVIEDGACDPFAALEGELDRFRVPTRPGLPPFQTGAVGFLGYELGRHLEKLPPPHDRGPALPDLAMGLYDCVCAFDNTSREAWVMANNAGGRDGETLMANMAARMAAAPPLAEPDWRMRGCWRAETERADYEEKVARVIDYIKAGDIFQANLSQRFLASMPGGLTPFALYRRLSALSPAPFSAFLACGPGRAVLTASPERFLKLGSDGKVETRPIKGTRPRGKTLKEDEKLAGELKASEKDKAENLMIVDLLRNDLSRVCKTGSVRVTDLFTLESFASVHHLVSGVTGDLEDDAGAVDLLRAAFPGGSVTGAPKIRAMEIINEMESARRGPYCGAIAWMGFDGAMDSSVTIRSITVERGRAVAQAGGGIVADSDPAQEFEETLVKAGPLLACLDPEAGR